MCRGRRRGRCGTGPAADPAASPPWPLAIGVLLISSTCPAAARAEHRLHLGLGAYRAGYYLLDVLEVDPRTDGDWAPVEALVARAGPDTLVIHGPAMRLRLDEVPGPLAHLPLRLLPR